MEGSRCKFNHHATALTSKILGNGNSSINWDNALEAELKLYLSLNKINLLVEGDDFILNDVGGIAEWRFEQC